MKNKVLAFYLRLSMSDGDLGKDNKDESNSIENQRVLIQSYVDECEDLTGEVREYIDDGYTGTNFNRPGFQRLLKDVQNGLVETILVKDLSRLGRDYIGVGDYIEQIFPVLGVRFIAVNNNFDSASYGSTMGLDMAVSNLINNLYSRDIGKKIRATFEVKWKQGYATAFKVPFGYLWDRKNKGKWKIDPVASQYVRRVFDLALQGCNTTRIAAQLNEESVPSPGKYALMIRKPGTPEYVAPVDELLWNPSIVWRVLRNYEYTGALVMGKRKQLVMGEKVYRSVPTSEQIISENAHEAIVTHDEFDTAQCVIRSMSPMSYKTQWEYPLKGKVRCGNCKRVLGYCERYGEGAFLCNHKHSVGKYAKCFEGFYREDMTNARVAYAIGKMIGIVNFLEEEISKKDDKKSIVLHFPNVEQMEKEIEILNEERIRQYEAYADGVISREAYIQKKKELSDKIDRLQDNIAKAEGVLQEATEVLDGIRDISKRREELPQGGGLTKELVDAFIDTVYLYDEDKIEVVFNCEDAIRAALDSYNEKMGESEYENN